MTATANLRSVHHAPFDPKMTTSPIAHVIHGGGVSLFHRGILADILVNVCAAPKKDNPFAGLPVETNYIWLHVPRLPLPYIQQIISFFRAECERKKEAYVQVLYKAGKGKQKAEWQIVVPPQRVSGASVDHDGVMGHRDGWLHVWDIHSHHTMNAYFSGGDDEDEKKHHRLCAVVGKLDKPVPEVEVRVGNGAGQLMLLNLDTVWELDAPLPVTYTLADLMACKKVEYTFPTVEYPDAWHEQLQYYGLAGGGMRAAGFNSNPVYGPGMTPNGYQIPKAWKDMTKRERRAAKKAENIRLIHSRTFSGHANERDADMVLMEDEAVELLARDVPPFDPEQNSLIIRDPYPQSDVMRDWRLMSERETRNRNDDNEKGS